MLPRVCVCGWAIPGEDREANFAALRLHADETHPEYGLADHDLRDYLDALERMSPPGPRLDSIGQVEVRRVGPGEVPDFLDYFDNRAFAAFPIWAGCYCMAHHVAPAEWNARDAACNRGEMAERLAAGTTTGYLAYVDGRAAGWCNASPRAAYPHYEATGEAVDGRVGAVVCYVIAAPYRRHGLARALLDAAVDGFRSDGFTAVEAYPRRPAGDGNDNDAYHGPLGMYLAAGFEEVGEAERWVVVRRRLG